MEPLQKEFVKYPSIENTYNVKMITRTRQSNIVSPDIVWAALEKIHGANFSIECTQNTASYCRRKDFVSKPIPIPCEDVVPYFTEKFFNCEKLVKSFHNKLGDLYQTLKQKFPEMGKFYLFGEYFGGHWVGINKEEVPHVQKGVYYSPDHHYYVFDCLIENNRWLSVKELIEIVDAIVPVVPVHKTGTFQEILAIDAVFDSTIPKLLGLEMKEKNICEGVVIRPYEVPKHIIFKKKNQEFLEITKAPIPKAQKEKEKQENQGQVLTKQLLSYLNQNRVASAYSKMPNAGVQQLGTEVLNDILEEAEKNGVKLSQSQEVMGRITKHLKNLACSQAAKYLKDIKGEGKKDKPKQEQQGDILDQIEGINLD